MAEQSNLDEDVDSFILNRIDSVPHLEAVLLLWRSRTTSWSAEKLTSRLFVSPEVTASILQDLIREGLVRIGPDLAEPYQYNSDPGSDHLMAQVESAYAREMIRISTMIHAKASSSVREFARAFRFKKEQK